MRVGYVRMYADADGASHFEDLNVDLEERDFAPPAAPAFAAAFLSAKGTLFFSAGPEWGGEIPHPSPQRQLFCVMRGAVAATVSDGERREFAAGDLILLDDTFGKGHATRVLGQEELLLFGTVLADQDPSVGPTGGPS